MVQISDPHIFAPGQLMEGRVDTAEGLRLAVQVAESLEPDLIVMSGDLVNDGEADQYANLRDLLGAVTRPLLLVAGNHDHRDSVRALASSLETAVEPLTSRHGELEYDIGGCGPEKNLRIIVVDTVREGFHSGLLTDERLRALDAQLGSEEPTLIVQHHPPFTSGIDFMDHYGLEGGASELDVLARHPEVVAVLTGHLHRHAVHIRSGLPVVTAPSSAAQVSLDLHGGPTAYTEEPGAVLVHRLDGSSLTTHVQPLRGASTWRPAWAL